MRGEFSTWVREFPKALLEGPAAFTNSPLRKLVTKDIPSALDEASPGILYRYRIKGSIGQGGWTHTPWVAVLDPAVTDSVQSGYYIVYLLSADAQRLYLSLNQGCTLLFKAVGEKKAAAELRRRAALARARIQGQRSAFRPTAIDLGSDVWRGRLYEAGEIASVEYQSLSLPPEDQLVADLDEALRLYKLLDNEGGWAPEDVILTEASIDEAGASLEQAKRYRQHRSIERKSHHSRKVKRLQGSRCRACDLEMQDVYGSAAKDLIEAHHLVPLSSLADGSIARFNPLTDFVVLCPNCHAAIHRMPDPSDVSALRTAMLAMREREPA